MIVGVISDTHGLLRPEAIEALRGVDHILHAGDVGKFSILDSLSSIAPLTAIRGNIDKGPEWAQRLPATTAVELGGHWFYLVHAIEDLDLDPATAGMSAIIYGHSHKPFQAVKQNLLYLNPGSAGPRRFSLPITLAKVYISATGIRAEIIPLISP
ncbi:MAG: metallophosphatase family protein [Bacteroidia bacterium]|nr:metallophosphatase family protein [Bacteroidia bacterium]